MRRVERRRESRLPAHAAASIRWDVDGECERIEAVNLLESSERGLSFRSREPLAAGQKILVEIEQQKFEAVVRHTAPDGQAFITGAEITSVRSRAADGDSEDGSVSRWLALREGGPLEKRSAADSELSRAASGKDPGRARAR
jgi:hypothetical protein